MAVTVTQDRRTNDMVEWTVIATADADTTTGAIAHGLGIIPKMTLIPVLAAARISLWVNTLADVTNWTATKATTVGSGDAATQLRVRAERP